MKHIPTEPVRTFRVGLDNEIEIKECARIRLEPNEQVTFLAENGAEYDFVRKDWGFYASPSLNGRLIGMGLRSVLVKGPAGKFFFLVVEVGKEALFQTYIDSEKIEIISWLDTKMALEKLELAIKGKL
jgi:hypothetical protein